MKRYLSMILSVLLLLQVFCMTSFAADSAAQFALSKVSGKVGEIVEVQLSVSSTEAYNSVALHELDYDHAALKFVGFGDTDVITDKLYYTEEAPNIVLPASFDDEKQAITFGMKESNVLNGEICTLQFEILATAEEKTYPIAMTSLVKDNATVLPSSVAAGAVVVSNEPEELRDIYVEITDGIAKPGEKFTVSVNVTENPGFNYMQLVLDYNADIMTLAGMGYAEFGNVGNNKNTYSWTNMAGDFTNIGTLMTLTFEVNTDAEPGIYKNAISVSRGNSGINDYGENLLGLVATPANVTIEDASCKHPNITWHEPKDATCQLPGNIGYAECESCGGTFTTADASEPIYDIATPINPKNHTGETYEKIEVDATATTEGYYGIYCKGCNAYLEKGETIPIITTPLIRIEDVSVLAGEEFQVDIILENFPAINKMGVRDIKYDTDMAEFVKAEWKNIDQAILSAWMPNEKVGSLAFQENTDCNGVIMTLTFVAHEDVEGEFAVSCTTIVSTMNPQEIEIKHQIIPGKVTVLQYDRGDVNGDRYLDANDAIHLLFFTMMPDLFPINQDGDMNGDGYIDANDAIHLLFFTMMPDLFPLT